ncbi:MAG: replication initiator protein A [Oscillospiraceae bacterium]|nr:replication initiator protein A [Oscillospiraceae bacterium]
MRAAQMKVRPNFTLMKQTDVQSLLYMKMPRWLFFDPRYADLSLDAKVAYTFLLNRFQISRRKGWRNEMGEVFIIFPRRALAQELRICERRVSLAFRALAERELIWEKRCGRGEANQIYLARVEPQDDPDYECTPFSSDAYEDCGTRTSDYETLDSVEEPVIAQEAPDAPVKNGRTGGFRTSDLTVQEPPNRRSSKKETSKKEPMEKEVSPSISGEETDGQTDGPDEETELTDILDNCGLSFFPPETARVFENAIERLYYSDSFRIGNATLPQSRVRRRLRYLDDMILRDAASKLAANTEKNVRNSTVYTMVTIFNCISESDSDLMVDPYLNSLALPLEGSVRQ